MLRRLIGSFLLLTGLAWGQSQTQSNLLRFRPPFSGLNQGVNQLDIPDNGFFILSNAALTSTGELYKRGSFGTLPYNSAALKVAKNNASKNIGIGSMYRYSTNAGLRRLLVTAFNWGPDDICVPGEDSTQFANWFWLNDTTGRFAYTYTCSNCLVDTLSQVEYHKGNIRIRQDAGGAPQHRSEYILSDSATFFLNCGSYSDIIFDTLPSGCFDLFGHVPYGVLVVNDTMLVFERDSIVDGGGGPDTVATNRRYEVHYRTAHNQLNSPTQFYAEAMTYLDTLYFSRSMFDPVGWDGKQTHRVNVLDHGVFDSTLGKVNRDSGKAWTANQWGGGFWLFLRRANHMREEAANNHRRWRSSWYLIDSSSANGRYIYTRRAVDDSAYAIVSMPIDEVIFERGIATATGVGSDAVIIDTSYFSYRTQKMIYTSPLQLLIAKGPGRGRLYQATEITKDTIIVQPELSDPTVVKDTRVILLRSRFPIAKFVRVFKDRTLWISDTIYQNTIFQSLPGRPGYIVPNTHIVINPTDGQRIQAVWQTEDAVYLAKDSRTYALVVKSIETSGDDPNIWQVVLVSDNVGCESPKSVVQRGNNVWFFDWPRGFYSFSSNGFELISAAIQPMIDSITPLAKDKVWGVYYPTRQGGTILWGLPLNGSLKCNRIVSYSPETKAWSTWNLTNTDSIRISSALVQEGPGDIGELFLALADSSYLLRYNPDGNQDTLRAQGGNRTNTFVLTAESKRFELPGQDMRFTEIIPMVNVGGTATVNYDFYKKLSTTSLQTLALSHSAGWNNIKKGLSDAVNGNQLGFRITTVSGQSFRFGGMDIEFVPIGYRLAE